MRFLETFKTNNFKKQTKLGTLLGTVYVSLQTEAYFVVCDELLLSVLIIYMVSLCQLWISGNPLGKNHIPKVRWIGWPHDVSTEGNGRGKWESCKHPPYHYQQLTHFVVTTVQLVHESSVKYFSTKTYQSAFTIFFSKKYQPIT